MRSQMHSHLRPCGEGTPSPRRTIRLRAAHLRSREGMPKAGIETRCQRRVPGITSARPPAQPSPLYTNAAPDNPRATHHPTRSPHQHKRRRPHPKHMDPIFTAIWLRNRARDGLAID
ncbi:hypothetical protein GCM10010219_40760 [Streptomyces netropsis]|nr:hypothetical protein GCM10010219_40760 [Streptomyces netropsis]